MFKCKGRMAGRLRDNACFGLNDNRRLGMEMHSLEEGVYL